MEDKLLYKDLTYKIRGILFETHNELGRMLNEKQYADYLEGKFKYDGIVYKREEFVLGNTSMERKRRCRTDFIIENRIIVELKAVSLLTKDDYFQCQRYLATAGLELALLVNFRTKYLTIKRILNHELYNQKLANHSHPQSHP
ncbi:MAG: GxxExxY protein [Candidatus Magasanikbacteria bacterium]|nr:GxxExxY protein [Candidatus Magasanikbacteria bacterium]